MNNCAGCIFLGTFHDMGSSTDVCEIYDDLLAALKACGKSEQCEYKITKREAREFAIARARGAAVTQREIPDVAAAVTSAAEALKKLSDALKGKEG